MSLFNGGAVFPQFFGRRRARRRQETKIERFCVFLPLFTAVSCLASAPARISVMRPTFTAQNTLIIVPRVESFFQHFVSALTVVCLSWGRLELEMCKNDLPHHTNFGCKRERGRDDSIYTCVCVCVCVKNEMFKHQKPQENFFKSNDTSLHRVIHENILKHDVSSKFLCNFKANLFGLLSTGFSPQVLCCTVLYGGAQNNIQIPCFTA